MSKSLKTTILLVIITLGFLFLGTEVKAVYIEPTTIAESFSEKDVTISGTTITLNEDVDFENDVVEIFNGDFVLNLNGHTLKAYDLYVSNGKLTIEDSTDKGKIDVKTVGVEPTGTLIINNGTFQTDMKETNEYDGELIEEEFDTSILNSGNLIINDGIFEGYIDFSENSKGIINNGNIPLISTIAESLIINNGNIHSIWNSGNLTINYGNITDVGHDAGSLTINGGVFTAYNRIDERDEEGNVIASWPYCSLFNINAETNINGGEFKTKDLDYVIKLYGNNENKATENSINELIGDGFEVEYTNASVTEWEEITYGSIKVKHEIFDKFAPNGIWTIDAAKPNNMDESESLLTSIANNFELPEGYEFQAWCAYGEPFNTEIIHINLCHNGTIVANKNVRAVYKEPSKSVMNQVTPVVNKIAEKIDEVYLEETGFMLEDLYLINYLNVEDGEINDNLALNFAKDLINLTNGSNISYKFDFRCGNSGNGLWSSLGGNVIVYYDGIAVDTTKIGLNYANVIYVPSDTADTDEARIAAAIKRIENYLGKTGISMTVGGTLESITNEVYDWNENNYFDETTSGTNYYNLTINGKTYKFVICKKDVNQLETPKYVGTDVISNISVTSGDTTIPLDTAVIAKKIENSDTIKNALGTENYEAYDISLYSNAKQKHIKTLTNGVFSVSIPIPEKLKDKDLIVYFVDDAGEKTPHTTTVDNEIATFETNHFSTYVLAETVKEEIETYEVVLDANGGVFKGEKKTLTIEKWENGMEETLESPTQDGYKFLGYFTEKTGGTELKFILAEAGIYKDITFYAQWEKIETEESKTEEPKIEESKTEEPKIEEPKIEEPEKEDTKIEEINKKPTINNPQTGDNIVLFAVLAFIAVVGVLTIVKLKKHAKK